MSKIECMTIGGLGAYWYFYKRNWILRILYSKIVQALSIIAVPFLLYFTPYLLQDGVHMVYAVCFLIIILNASTNPKPLLKIENKITDYLGIISYGIYMYHLLMVVLVLNFLKHYLGWGGEMSLFQNLTIYGACFGLTVLASSLSYRYLEKPFIRMKKRFTKIRSGEEARE